MDVGDIIVLIGSALLIMDGIIKFVKPDSRFRGNPPPGGLTLLILGVGLLLKSMGV